MYKMKQNSIILVEECNVNIILNTGWNIQKVLGISLDKSTETI